MVTFCRVKLSAAICVCLFFCQYFLEGLYQDVSHQLHPFVVGVQGRVITQVGELPLTATFSKEIGYGE